MVHLPNDAPCPRLCTLQKHSLDEEYGYNLHAEKGRGQFVGTVDKGSIADRAGLHTGDRIFAVNGHSIQGEGHKKVVERIKQDRLKCELLVIDADGAEWYKKNGIDITAQLPNVIRVCQDDNSHRSSTINSSPPPNTWYAPAQNNNTTKISPVLVAPISTENGMKPRPLLCQLRKASPTDEFGFNLHAEKGRGHFIGTVDQGGIGDLAGLRMGQRIVGVNGELVYPSTAHKDVVSLIKRSPLATSLLVANEEVDKWYKDHQEEYSFTYIEDDSTPPPPSYPPQEFTPHSIQVNGEEEHENHYHVSQDSQEKIIARKTTLEEQESPYTSSEKNGLGHNTPSTIVSLTPVATSASDDQDLLNAVFAVLPPVGSESAHVHEEEHDHTSKENLLRFQHDIQECEGHTLQYDQHSHTSVAEPEAPSILGQVFANSVPSEEPQIDHATEEPHNDHDSTLDYSHYISKPTAVRTATHHSTEQISPVSQNSSGYGHSDSSQVNDREFSIYNLSAKEARERLRTNKRDQRYGVDMSLEDKYRLVSNM